MKKTRRNEIPDFSAKPKGIPAANNSQQKVKPPAPGKVPMGKPQATSSKSGHRGS